MTCICQLCGEIITGPPQAALNAIEPESERGRIVDFDALAAHMWSHISDRHPNQVQEGIMIQRKAAKMYAMNWATLDEQQTQLRIEHRKQLLVSLTVTTQFAGDQPAADSDSSGTGSGENMKKSSKNASN